MSGPQKRIFLALSIAIALTRFAAVAPALFDWDEAQFVSAVREYDVTRHEPHPPGYPLFVALAKVGHLAGAEPFRALQSVVILGALLLFPALFWLARELGFGFATAASGAAIFAFLPNVWVYGGTAFSDVPATALAFAACALLLRGRRDSRAYVAGAIVLALAAGFRPLNLLAGMLPALAATFARIRAKSYAPVATAIVLGAAIVAASYAGAALASTGFADFIDTVRGQSRYVRDVDSWRNPSRGPLRNAAVTFLLYPVQHRDVLNVLAIAASISFAGALFRRRAAPLFVVSLFAPLAVISVLELDVNAASRYAVSFMAVHALLAADGLHILLRTARAQVALAAAVVAFLIVVAWPAVREQRTSVAPPVAALRYAAARVDRVDPLYVHGSMRPHARALLPDRELRFFVDFAEVPHGAWVVDPHVHRGGTLFVRGRRGTWRVLRRRNFEAAVLRK